MSPDVKRLRAAITAQLKRQPMTVVELAAELEHIAAKNAVSRQVAKLVAADIVVGIECGAKPSKYELWEVAIERLKCRPAPCVRSRRTKRPATRIA